MTPSDAPLVPENDSPFLERLRKAQERAGSRTDAPGPGRSDGGAARGSKNLACAVRTATCRTADPRPAGRHRLAHRTALSGLHHKERWLSFGESCWPKGSDTRVCRALRDCAEHGALASPQSAGPACGSSRPTRLESRALNRKPRRRGGKAHAASRASRWILVAAEPARQAPSRRRRKNRACCLDPRYPPAAAALTT